MISVGGIVGVVGDVGRDLLFDCVEASFFFCLITCCLFIIVIGDTDLLLILEQPCDMMGRFNLIAKSKGHRVRRCLGVV